MSVELLVGEKLDIIGGSSLLVVNVEDQSKIVYSLTLFALALINNKYFWSGFNKEIGLK